MQGTPTITIDTDTVLAGQTPTGKKVHGCEADGTSLCGYGWNTGARLIPFPPSTSLDIVDCSKCRKVIDDNITREALAESGATMTETQIVSRSAFRRVTGSVFVNIMLGQDVSDVKVSKRDLIATMKRYGFDQVEFIKYNEDYVKVLDLINSKEAS